MHNVYLIFHLADKLWTAGATQIKYRLEVGQKYV